MKITLKEMRNDARYINAVVLKGNNKLLDYDNPETGEKIRYAQFSTRALKDCPYKSDGCAIVCYATKGLHNFPSVKKNRVAARAASEKDTFAGDMIFTLETEFKSGRYNGKHMMFRLHESGDFYSMEYLNKWIDIIEYFTVHRENNITFCFYTKSFPYFVQLDDRRAAILNKALAENVVAMSMSIDDTTTVSQIAALAAMKKRFPLANVYACTENVETVKHDNVCDCADCAACGHCTRTSGKTTVVKIHSANKKEMTLYRKRAAKNG